MAAKFASKTLERLGQVTSHLTGQTRTMATSFKINTGAQFPAIGFGTWQDAGAQADAVYEAIKAGYRHIDTARVYGTEPAVAEGIKRAGVPRDQLFIVTKLWNSAHHPEDVEKALNDSLKDLQTDYVDLYLMHFPIAFKRSPKLFPKDENKKLALDDIDYVDTYKAMEKLVHAGKAKAIGISNFSLAQLQRLIKEASIKPAVHQLELHPYLQQKSFLDFHKNEGIVVTAYSSLGNANEIYDHGKTLPKLIEQPILAEIGKKHNKSPSQVALAWAINQGVVVIPKSKTPKRIQENFESNFKLDDEDMEKIATLDKKARFNEPSADWGYEFFGDLDGHRS